ncbi:reverse transcriptase domain-containing protein [Tanacetum coccineum]
MPSHIGSYDGKGDPDNFLHLFEGAIRMQKWLMPVACHMFTYTLKDSARIWWNSQKAGSILDYEDLKAKFRSHFSQQKKFTKTHLAVHNIKQRENENLPLTYKGLIEKTYTWVEAREVATNSVSSDRRDSFERPKKSSWDNNRGQKNKDRFSPYRGPNHSLLSNLSKSPREILATERAAKSFEPPPKMFGSKRSRDTSKYCHFYEDYGHDTNDCRHLKVQIQEAINSRQLSHLVKGIKKEKAKEDYAAKNTVSESMAYKEEITFPPVTRVETTQPVINEATHAENGDRGLNNSRAIKFHTKKGVGTVLSVGEAGEETKKARRTLTTNKERIPSCDDTEEKIIVNDKYPEQMVTIGKLLPKHFKKELRNLLRANADIFAWTHADMTRIPRTTYINKACPKDCYPLPEIDWKIESLVGFRLKCFLDAYKGYHQIQMAKGDEDKTAFFVGEGVFCYGKMPFGLKNAGATYQRLVDKVFSKQIGRNLETYVDDMVIKSTSEEGMLSDIQETFERFRSINMKLNPKKCSFGVEEGPFLGHLITKQGIKANPSKIKAVTELEQPRALKDIQSLNGKLAALSHFLYEVVKKDTFILKQESASKYLQAHTIMVLIGTPIKQALTGPEKTGRIAKWAIELVKEKEVSDPSNEWKLYTNGASISDGAGAGLMLIDPAGKEYTYALHFEFETTNNEEEYKALLAGLRIAQEMEIMKVAIFLDSQLVVNQIKGTYAAKQLSIKSYLQKVKTALKGFEGYTVEHVRRNQNKKAEVKQAAR